MPTSHLVNKCGSCGSRELTSILWLGYMQPACSMPKIGEPAKEETHYPLELLQCQKCSLVQLSCIVDPKVIFHPEYPYSSGNTKALRENFAELASEIRQTVKLGREDLVVDIGSNDGTLLGNFTKTCLVRGYEPTRQAETANSLGIHTVQRFFGSTAYVVPGKAKVITACNVLAHVENVHDVLDGVAGLLADDGIFVTENHYLGSLIDGLQWDSIYHEHLRYYSLKSLRILLGMHGLNVFRADLIPSHGGSFRVFARRGNTVMPVGISEPEAFQFDRFSSRVAESKRSILNMLARTDARIVAVGAAARGATLLNYCGIDVEMVEVVVEVKGSDKIGHYMPGTRIPVVAEAMLYEEQPENLLILPWQLAGDLVPKFAEKGYRGKVILPLGMPGGYAAGRWDIRTFKHPVTREYLVSV